MFKIVVAFFVVLGAIIWGQHHAATWITQQAADLPPQDVLPQSTFVLPKVDPDQMRRTFDTPGYYPGLHR